MDKIEPPIERDQRNIWMDKSPGEKEAEASRWTEEYSKRDE